MNSIRNFHSLIYPNYVLWSILYHPALSLTPCPAHSQLGMHSLVDLYKGVSSMPNSTISFNLLSVICSIRTALRHVHVWEKSRGCCEKTNRTASISILFGFSAFTPFAIAFHDALHESDFIFWTSSTSFARAKPFLRSRGDVFSMTTGEDDHPGRLPCETDPLLGLDATQDRNKYS